MNIKFFCKGLSSDIEKKLRDYMDKKMSSFEKLVGEFDDDTVQLQITAERYEKNNAYNVEMILKMPKKRVVASEDSHSIEKAVDLAKDRIIKQMKKAGEKNRVRRKKQPTDSIAEPIRTHRSIANRNGKVSEKEIRMV